MITTRPVSNDCWSIHRLATEEIKELARKLYASDEIAIDDDAIVSKSDDSAGRSCWVQAWVWLADADFLEDGEAV